MIFGLVRPPEAALQRSRSRFVLRIADLLDRARDAERLPGDANFAPKPDHLMAEGNPSFLRNDFHQVLLHLFRGIREREFQAVRNAENVRIHYQARGDSVSGAQNDISRFTRNPGKSEQVFHVLRHVPLELRHDLRRRAHDVFCLIAVEAGGANVLGQHLWPQGGKILRGGILCEKPRRHHVHTHVCALRRKYGCHQKLKWVFVLQGALRVREQRVQCGKNLAQAARRSVIRFPWFRRFGRLRFGFYFRSHKAVFRPPTIAQRMAEDNGRKANEAIPPLDVERGDRSFSISSVGKEDHPRKAWKRYNAKLGLTLDHTG